MWGRTCHGKSVGSTQWQWWVRGKMRAFISGGGANHLPLTHQHESAGNLGEINENTVQVDVRSRKNANVREDTCRLREVTIMHYRMAMCEKRVQAC